METKHRSRRELGMAFFLLGSLIVAVGAWLPWVVSTYTVSQRFVQLYFDPGSAPTIPLLSALGDRPTVAVAWALVTIFGVALGPLLTTRTPRWLPRAGHALAGLWLLGASVLVVTIAVMLLQGTYGRLVPGPDCTGCGRFPPLPRVWGVGLFSVLWGLVAGWIGWVLALRGTWRVPVDAGSLTLKGTSVPAQRFEFGLLGTGIVIWALGFYLMPWVTQSCSTVWFLGQCSGFPANAVAQAGLSSQQLLDPLVMADTVPLLLGIGALYLAVALARRRFNTRAACTWLGAWLVLAIAVEGVAIAGAQTIVDSIDDAKLTAGLGMVVAAFGLVLVAVGLIVAVVMALLERPRQSPAGS